MPIGSAFDDVLTAARAGADWAWARIYDDLAPPMLGYLRMRGAPDPEDLTGEVFLHIVRNLSSFRGDEGAFRSWVFVIAHHRLVDDLRRRGRRPVDPVPMEVLHARSGVGDVEREALETLSTSAIRGLLDLLSDDQRDVLLLRVIGGLTVEEVARALRKRPGAVKGLQRRGLAAIRRHLETQGVTL